jgi:molybdenum cofactor cytidylyltransferase
MHILILAAGASTRLGQPKQLVRLGGRPALHHVMSNALAMPDSTVSVIIGAHAGDLTGMLGRSSASIVVNRNWEEGIASSIRAGLAAAPPSCDAVMT